MTVNNTECNSISTLNTPHLPINNSVSVVNGEYFDNLKTPSVLGTNRR